MNESKKKVPQISLLLRLLCGGYLVYLAWGLREAAVESILYLAAAIVFGLIGLVLAIHSGLALMRGDYDKGEEATESSEAEDTEEDKDDAI